MVICFIVIKTDISEKWWTGFWAIYVHMHVFVWDILIIFVSISICSWPQWSLGGRSLCVSPSYWCDHRFPDAKSRLIRKDLDAGKDCRREEKGMTEDEMVWWHHWLDWHEFEQSSADSEGQGAWHAAVHGDTKSQIWLSDGTTDL